jgi:hypothetical protein
MHQILPHALWVGHAGDARDLRRLFDLGIKALVELAVDEAPTQPPRELIYCRFPLVDGTGNDPDLLSLTLNTVAALLRMHVPALLTCSSGMSRSLAIAAAALALAHQEKPEECLLQVAQHCPGDVSPGLWQELTELLSSKRE